MKTEQNKITRQYTNRFRRRLLHWYDSNGRRLPWRKTKDPYRIWVSEIMLQQTQVSRVQEYYSHFLKQFPTVESLASSPLDKVLKAWEGLGYYSRARNLHKAAGIISRQNGGRIPDSIDSFSSLPGIGPYTAGAVMSIAFGQPYPVLDGNIKRILCRVMGIRKNPSERKTQQSLKEIASRLLPKKKAGMFNQALMDLGAMICRPAGPKCTDCCIQPLCHAQSLSDPSSLPVRVPKPIPPHFDVTAGIIWKGSRILIAQRQPEGLLGGMWEFPGGKKEGKESLRRCLHREIREELGIEIEIMESIGSVQHAYSHFRITLHGFNCRYAGGRTRAIDCADWKWILPSELPSFAMPRADTKLMETWKKKKGAELWA